MHPAPPQPPGSVRVARPDEQSRTANCRDVTSFSFTSENCWKRKKQNRARVHVRVYVCTSVGPIFGNHTKKPPFSRSGLLLDVVERAAGLLRTSPSLAEGMQVVRYAAGEHYHAHADYHTGMPGTEGYNRAPGFYNDPSVRTPHECCLHIRRCPVGGSRCHWSKTCCFCRR